MFKFPVVKILQLSRQSIVVIVLILVTSLVLLPFSWADDAMVLPKSRGMVSLGVDIYPYWDKEFNDEGHAESLAFDYNRELNSQVFPDLKLIEQGIKGVFNLPLSLGQSIVSFEKKAVITNIIFSYGISDNLTFGMKIPFWKFKTKVESALDQKSANMIKNPQFNPNLPPDPNNSPLLPIFFADPNYLLPHYSNPILENFKLTREDILNLLSGGIPEYGLSGFGYKRFDTWSDDDLGDIEIGMKYKYFQNREWRLAFQGGIRFPTGRKDDPDNLVDYGFGGGNYDVILGFQNDYLGYTNLVINGSVRYTLQLSDTKMLRIPSAVDLPLTKEKKLVDRDYGDIFELELSASYRFLSGFGLNTTYNGYFKEKDSMKIRGAHYTTLEEETRQVGHHLIMGISYNNLAKYKETQSGAPFQTSINYWQRFDGKNLNQARYYSLNITLFF